MSSEPVLTAAAVQAVATAVIALLVAFGVHITQDQTAALLGIIAPVFAIAGGLFARTKVTPTVPPAK